MNCNEKRLRGKNWNMLKAGSQTHWVWLDPALFWTLKQASVRKHTVAGHVERIWLQTFKASGLKSHKSFLN